MTTETTSMDDDARDARSFGSLGRRAPSWWEPEEGEAAPEPWLTPDEALDRFLDWTTARGVELWPHQEEALMGLMVGDHVILGTPTGSGKSMVALGMCFMAMATGRRSYYTAPIKALVSEKFFDLVEVFGRENVGMITGDAHINAEAPIICCTAEILANQALREGEHADVGCVAMDEFHFYGDADRGWAWQVPLLTLPKTQFLLMSATLGDVSDIATSLEERTGVAVDVVADAPRPVPLAYEYVEMPLEGTVELALRKGEAPLYLVHFSQDAALATAQALSSYGVATKEQRELVKEAIKGTRFTTAFGKTLKRLVSSGVGVHHAGMLPRYRLLVEKLAQQGLLPVICGTDTLGVGINVPIHTVVLTALTKFDGHKMRRLRAREFHQIVGRAGRSGFDTEGMVVALAPEHEIENAKLLAKAAGDPKKIRKIKKRQPPEGFVTWNKQTFERLIEAVPEKLKARLRITHAMVLSEVVQGGDAYARVRALIADSAQISEEKTALYQRADEIFQTLIDAEVVERGKDADGEVNYVTTVDVPEDFALDQPLSPFLLAALELLEPEDETYALDVISLAEATLEDPRQVLRAQERAARDKAMAEMKADGIEYDERLERLADITYPRPLEDVLEAAFEHYCKEVPWARDFELAPKSVVRDMVESASDFKTYVGRYKIARSEGTLLRYLSDAYRVLDRTVPAEARDERLEDIVSWLGFVVRSVDSSLVDEWESAGAAIDAAPPAPDDAVVRDRRGLTVLVRNALFRRVRLAARNQVRELGELDQDLGWAEPRWQQALEAYFEVHESILVDGDARSMAYLSIDESDERTDHVWHVRQIFSDPEGDHDFALVADVDLDATQEEGEALFKNYAVGFFEDLTQ
ncbi:DEAD/DEAH box helicase [Eggerthella sp. YY7918]|uniref:DEAD/DEAH box helicase n=1 Tax=Eggerthella sp. (strain YY7918) TaxID=502558 RepID=UPI00350EA5B2